MPVHSQTPSPSHPLFPPLPCSSPRENPLISSLANPPVTLFVQTTITTTTTARCVWIRAVPHSLHISPILYHTSTHSLHAIMLSGALSTVALLAAVLPTALAQTSTLCNPLEERGCPNMPALGANLTFNFTERYNDKVWTKPSAGVIEANEKSEGSYFSLRLRGESPTLHSNFYMFFGRLEVVMRAAAGKGIISTAILQSEDLDEIDWEFMGGNSTHAFTNYYGKGNSDMPTPNRGIEPKMDSSPLDGFHNYTIDWTEERIEWILDDKVVRTLKYEEAKGSDGKSYYPQTPMNVRIGLWAAGDVENNKPGVVEWAGGETDFKQAPFSMIVKSVYAADYTNAKEYSWDDMDDTGDHQKVKIIGKDTNQRSQVFVEATKPTGVDRIKAMSTTTKIAIGASVAGVVLIGAALIAFCCVKQRRAGRKEYATFQAQENQEKAEYAMHKQNWQSRASRYARV
ncbi:unnamed protein product [Periconia digitata]|uniref:chitinase n=1 Tax=Periconia digitata TaxID=1303443 RepID=A0A9W4UQM5_9PLEO|nr:unnamed protein product [Periconia digitata]